MRNIISELQLEFPSQLAVRSRGAVREKYPASLGQYRLLQGRYHNGRPVYAREERFIIYIGE